MRNSSALLACVTMLVCVSSGCASEPKNPGKYPPRQPGCEIQIFPEEPSYQTDNIGTTRATCDESLSDAECLRELKDQACKLGADTVWGVSDHPTKTGSKKTLSGRAAHQR